MDVEQLEAEAIATAIKHIATLMQTPDQLEKVDQYRRKFSRKKASVEAMLKTAMQSQLDGVKSGLGQLHTALTDIKEIKQNLKEIEDTLQSVPTLNEKLKDIESENLKHSQYATAMENLKHIFNVPGTIESTRALINDGKLLEAHKSLSDLENSRDDLMFELHKLSTQSPTDKKTFKHYFSEVEKLSDMLAKQLELILKRTLNTIRQQPTVIVTVLRIIEREEKADEIARQLNSRTGFLAPGRPKDWRQKAFKIIEASVQERIEGNQFQERKDNPMWLVLHLEVTRLVILEDLKVVKTLCVPCFPPDYDIVNRYVKMYHSCLSRHLQDIIASGLEGTEFVTMLKWPQTYESDELLKHSSLNIDPKQVGPILDSSTVEKLMQQYLKNMEKNFQEWLKNTAQSEIQDYMRDVEPESDGGSFFHTPMPVIVFQLVEQNLDLAASIAPDLVVKVLRLCLEQVLHFTKLYREIIFEFKRRYFGDRSKVKYFTHYMVAIVNNCMHLYELALHLREVYSKKGVAGDEERKKFEILLKVFLNLRDEAAACLLEEVFIDLDPHFQDLITRKWLDSSTAVDTICITLEDYCQDYHHLRPKNFEQTMQMARETIAKKYLSAILNRKISYFNFEERKRGVTKILKETSQLQITFNKLAPVIAKDPSPLSIIESVGQILQGKDTELLPLELATLVRQYPDINRDHLSAILSIRDVGKIDNKQLDEIISQNKDPKAEFKEKTIFSEIEIKHSLPSLAQLADKVGT